MQKFDTKKFIDLMCKRKPEVSDLNLAISMVIEDQTYKENSLNSGIYFNFKKDIKKHFKELDARLNYTRIAMQLPIEDEEPYSMYEVGLLSNDIPALSEYHFLIRAFSRNETTVYENTQYSIDFIKNYLSKSLLANLSENDLINYTLMDMEDLCGVESILPSNIFYFNNGFKWDEKKIKKITDDIADLRHLDLEGEDRDEKAKGIHIYFLNEKNMNYNFNTKQISKNERYLRFKLDKEK